MCPSDLPLSSEWRCSALTSSGSNASRGASRSGASCEGSSYAQTPVFWALRGCMRVYLSHQLFGRRRKGHYSFMGEGEGFIVGPLRGLRW